MATEPDVGKPHRLSPPRTPTASKELEFSSLFGRAGGEGRGLNDAETHPVPVVQSEVALAPRGLAHGRVSVSLNELQDPQTAAEERTGG